ncbi:MULTISPECIES: DUF2934 domain-containing protein [Mesorhizobium]|uniref:DUF2934 domain-containing protein n=1 Tax=Mesorhizobium TaxID=68287 RepID=UPI0003CF7C8D|nr:MULTISPECIES: DUF2934 domain-containing protein [Mesorhizobium]ESY63311.1 hypothetical protein X742_29500 [Mesorhizobium sp. LNHC232B00]WJI39808.1 DUF2934 domain-containing protein [Mesorhizobium opportunistum]
MKASFAFEPIERSGGVSVSGRYRERAALDDIGWLHSNALLAIVACRRRAEVGPHGDNMTMADDRQERIRNRAHQIWQQEGQPAGQHERHWHQAAADVDAEHATGTSSVTKKPAKKAAGADKAKAAPKEAKAAKKPSKPKS